MAKLNQNVVVDSSSNASNEATVATTATTSKKKILPEATIKLCQDTLVKNEGNKSKSIRELAGNGMKTGDIASGLNIRYQFARNVLNQKPKKA